jgi:hypothetical protein
MRAISNFNPRDTAYVDASFKNIVGSYAQRDSLSSIKMTSFDNDAITYESNSSSNNTAIFSEIYYKDWKAYIDDKQVPFYKANYVLRGLTIPAGKHKIEFKFEPQSYFIGKKISNLSSWLLFLILIGAIVKEFISKKKEA